jgi:hypothetical protein
VKKFGPYGIVLKLQSADANLQCCLKSIRSGDLKLAEECGVIALSRLRDLMPTEEEKKERSDKSKLCAQIGVLKKKIKELSQKEPHAR